MNADKLVARLEQFKRTWLANPLAKADFARLIRDVHECPSRDHADAPLVAWVDAEHAAARGLGLKP